MKDFYRFCLQRARRSWRENVGFEKNKSRRLKQRSEGRREKRRARAMERSEILMEAS